MGCTQSSLVVKPLEHPAEENRYTENVPKAIESHANESVDTIYTFGSSQESQVDTVNRFMDAGALLDEPIPPPTLHWKLSTGEIKHQRTLQRLDDLKSVGLALLEVPKCRVCLISCTHLWISTRTGAFSPALKVHGAPWQGSFDHFYLDKRTDPFIMEDARLDPRCANHPGVKGRPNLRYYVGVPLLSRGHLIGIYYLAASEPHSRPSEEKISQLVDLANQAVDALQEDMFTCLLNNSTNNENNNKAVENKIISNDEIELPALWLDISTPKYRIVGANAAWETLTGISFDVLKETQGLLDIMSLAISSNVGGLALALSNIQNGQVDFSTGCSIPAVLSPASPNGVSLQYIFAMKPAAAANNQTATPSTVFATHTDGATNNNIWIAEVHGRVQATADAAGNLQIDPMGTTKLVGLPSSDPAFGSLLPFHEETFDRQNSISSPTGIYQSFSPRHYQYHTQPYTSYSTPPVTYQNTTAESSSSGGGGGGSGGGSGGTTGAASAGHHSSLDSLLVAASSFHEVGTMHIPPRLNTLQIGPILGKGSYGAVHWGTLGGVGVAIKVSQQAPGPEAEDQLWAAQYEAMVASDLSHSNLVRTIDWCCHYEGGVMWIIQELCDKGSLAIVIKQGALRVEQGNVESDPDMHAVLETAADVARGMRYLHAHDVIHGDLSSNNVLFISSEEGSRKLGFTAKISDLGLSRALGGDCATKTVGTISHMPPELLTSGVMAKGGDVYSFGVMLWELYTGKRAWNGCSQAQVIFAITCKKTGLELPSDAPAGYAALAMQCMDRERLNRPKFGEIVARLEELLEELS